MWMRKCCRALNEVIVVITSDHVVIAEETCRNVYGNQDSHDQGLSHERGRPRRRKFVRAVASDQTRGQLQYCPQCISTWAGIRMSWKTQCARGNVSTGTFGFG